MNEISPAYVALLIGMILANGIAWLAEAEYRDRTFMKLFWKWWGFRSAEKYVVALFLILNLVWGSTKTNEEQIVIGPPGQEQYMEGGASMMAGETTRMTTNQCLAGFALVSETNHVSWLTIPTNAVVYAPWTCYGAATDTFWLPATNWGFILGSNAVEGVHVASDGMLAFGWPKGSPRAAAMPDGTPVSFLAPLQGSLNIVPPEGRFWYAPTDSNSVLLTWQDAFAGSGTDSRVTFQAELFWNGDFTYRYAFTNALALTNFVVGAQHNGGGETYALSDTGLLVNGLELRWRAFGILDPGVDDHDGDGISTYDEVMRHGTDPRNADSDFDGLSDTVELAELSITTAMNPDTDGDGLADGIDPQPNTPNDPDATNSFDNLTYWYKVQHGLDPAADNSVDTDNDGWADWKEALAGSATNNNASYPGANGVPVLFDATITLNADLPRAAVLAVGTHTLPLLRARSFKLTLKEGSAYPVTLLAAWPCTVGLSVSFSSPFAALQDPGGIFSGSRAVNPAAAGVPAGLIALPKVNIVPETVCFHADHPKTVLAEVTPPMDGAYSWSWGNGLDVSAPHCRATNISWEDPQQYDGTSVYVVFAATGSSQSKGAIRNVSRCVLADEDTWCGVHGCEHWYCACDNPVGTGHCGVHNRPVEECLAETCAYHNCLRSLCPADWCHEHECLLSQCSHGGVGGGGGGPGDDPVTDTVSVNNDDDDAGGVPDYDDSACGTAEDDLATVWPFGAHDGTCCLCPAHQKTVTVPITLESVSSNLSVFNDDAKASPLAAEGEIEAGQSVYVEGLGASASVDAERLVWRWQEGGNTLRQTNAFTVLSVRLFGDITLDGTVDTNDIALHTSLSQDYGWGVPVASNAFRKVRLFTDVRVSGDFILSLAGDPGIRIWTSGSPASTNSPLLVSGQTVTNGVDGAAFAAYPWSDLYVEAVSNATATLYYRYRGTGDAENLSCSASLKMTAWNVDLDVDTNRDGDIDAEDDNDENDWTSERGAIYSVNFDSDGRTMLGQPWPDAIFFMDNGNVADEDYFIENAEDELDIAPLVIRKLPALPAGWSVWLKVAQQEDIQRIHVYKRIEAGTNNPTIWGTMGGATPATELDITQWVNPASPDFQGDSSTGDATFGIEGLCFRNQGGDVPDNQKFDGFIDFTLELRSGAAVQVSDAVRLKVAPWIMLPQTQASEEVWAMDAGDENSTFRLNASAETGYKGLDDSGQLKTVSGSNAGTQWFQDHVEIGYTQRPAGPKTHIVFRLPYGGNNPEWPLTRLLTNNVGVFQLGQNLGASYGSADFGGNLEVLPTNAVHKLGRIVLGDSGSASERLKQFLSSQEVQPPVFDVPVDWLTVAHIDETTSFLPDGNVAVADPTMAWSLLANIATNDRGRSVFFATGAVPISGIAVSNATANMRIETGIDYTGQSWKFIRIYAGNEAGTVGAISGLGNGYITVSNVWKTTSKVVNGNSTDHDIYYWSLSTEDGGGGEAPRLGIWQPQGGSKYVLCEGTRFWVTQTPAILTVEEVLKDPDFETLNTTLIQEQINLTKGRLQTASSAISFKNVPDLFFGKLDANDGLVMHSCVAFNPGVTNLQPLDGKLYVPRQFGPNNAARIDLFEDAIKSALGLSVENVDCWDLYHRWSGEIHCGSAVKRSLFNLNWWENQP